MWIYVLRFFLFFGVINLNWIHADYSIVFVHIGNKLPAYLETAVRQARLFNDSCPIIIIANQEALSNLSSTLEQQKPVYVPIETINKSAEHIAFIKNSPMKPSLWLYSVERFLYLYDVMVQHKLENVFHLENDNMLYMDLNENLALFQEYYSGIGATFDNDQRCIAGFMYAANPSSMQRLAAFFAKNAKKGHTDMESIANFKNAMDRSVIDQLPIIPDNYNLRHQLKSPAGHIPKEPGRFYNNFNSFNSIFDAAAIGQYLGGIDANYHHEVKVGFINESCIFNPSHFTYEWHRDAKNRNIPYINFEGKKYRINNLHIHSKQLHLFSSI